MGQIYANLQNYDVALEYFGIAIHYAKENLLSIDPSKLAEYFMHRASVHEALGNIEENRKDMHSILEADPNFIQRYHAQALQFEELGKYEESQRIKEFL